MACRGPLLNPMFTLYVLAISKTCICPRHQLRNSPRGHTYSWAFFLVCVDGNFSGSLQKSLNWHSNIPVVSSDFTYFQLFTIIILHFFFLVDFSYLLISLLPIVHFLRCCMEVTLGKRKRMHSYVVHHLCELLNSNAVTDTNRLWRTCCDWLRL